MTEPQGTITLYTAHVRGQKENTIYPNCVAVRGPEDLRQAAAWDHVCAAYKGNHRSNADFISADCLPVDLDNDHSDDPAAWKTLEDIRAAFPGVMFYAIPSRHNNRLKPDKDGSSAKSARPRYHVYFPIEVVTDWQAYRRLKEKALRIFPYFDHGAKDAARFLFGVEAPEVTQISGSASLTDFLKAVPEPAPQALAKAQKPSKRAVKTLEALRAAKARNDQIVQGTRNKTLYTSDMRQSAVHEARQ